MKSMNPQVVLVEGATQGLGVPIRLQIKGSWVPGDEVTLRFVVREIMSGRVPLGDRDASVCVRERLSNAAVAALVAEKVNQFGDLRAETNGNMLRVFTLDDRLQVQVVPVKVQSATKLPRREHHLKEAV